MYNLILLHLRSADILVTQAGPRDIPVTSRARDKHIGDDEHIYEEIVQDGPEPGTDEDKVSS